MDVSEKGGPMIMKFHDCRAMMPDRGTVPPQHEAPWNAQSSIIREKILQDSLIMFLDLGLTLAEMSRVSGFPPAVIENGLKQLDEAYGAKTLREGQS